MATLRVNNLHAAKLSPVPMTTYRASHDLGRIICLPTIHALHRSNVMVIMKWWHVTGTLMDSS